MIIFRKKSPHLCGHGAWLRRAFPGQRRGVNLATVDLARNDSPLEKNRGVYVCICHACVYCIFPLNLYTYYIYIYIYTCSCVCVCVMRACVSAGFSRSTQFQLKSRNCFLINLLYSTSNNHGSVESCPWKIKGSRSSTFSKKKTSMIVGRVCFPHPDIPMLRNCFFHESCKSGLRWCHGGWFSPRWTTSDLSAQRTGTVRM